MSPIRRGTAARARSTRGALALFAIALLAKTTAALLPAVLLVLAWWRGGRLRGADVRPLVPFFAVGAALALNTAWLEKTMVRASGAEWSLSPGRAPRPRRPGGRVLRRQARLAHRTSRSSTRAGRSTPRALATVAPRCSRRWPCSRRPGRCAGGSAAGPLAGLLLFGGVLFPAMGFFNVYAMRYSWVADHFAYQAVAIAAACVACGIATLAGGAVATPAVGCRRRRGGARGPRAR